MIDLFQQLFGFESDDPPVERLRKLEVALVAYGPPQPEAAPLLAALFSLPLGEGAAALGLTPERQKERTLETLLAILLRMAEAQPVVVSIEDLHWADPSTLDFLNLVMQKGASARIMLLLTHRPVFAPSWAASAPATHLRLDRLSDEHIQVMVEHIAGDKRLPEEVHRYIAEKTDGVPIFIEELTRTVLDSGWLVEGEEGYVLGRPLHLLAIPVTLQDLLLARLDRLGGAKDRALLASVLGREFTYEMLHAVSQADEPSLRRDLGDLVDGGLLHQLGEPPLATYTFKHALIQDAAYGLLLKATRQQYHRRVAEALAQGFSDVVQTQPELLAHHFTEAGLGEPAVGYWLRAARRAVERSANVEATGHVRQGLALLEQLPVSPGRDALELGLQSTLGSATIALKGYGSDEVERAFARALDLCEQLGNAAQRFRAELGLWMYYVVRADYARALELAERLLAMAEAQGTPAARVHASYCIGFSRFYLGEIEAAHDAFAAGADLECADGDPALVLPTGDDVRIHLLAFLGLALWHRGQPAEAMARCEQAILLARRLAHPYGIVFALNAATYLAMYLRDGERAKAAVGECLAIATDKGYRYFLAMGGFVRGWALAEAGAADEGIALMIRCLQGLRGAGALMGQTLMMVHLAGACVRHKRIEEAITWLGEMATAVEATGERFFEPELHRLRGECDVVVGADGAEAGFQRALDQARRQGDRGQELRAATSLARRRADQGRHAEGRELLAAVRERVRGFPRDQGSPGGAGAAGPAGVSALPATAWPTRRVLIVNCYFPALREAVRLVNEIPNALAPVLLAGAFARERCEIRLHNEVSDGFLEVYARDLLAWPDLVVFTGLTAAFDRMLHLTAYLRTLNPKVVTVAGGLAIRALPGYARRFFDYACTGDVEELREVVADALGPAYVASEMVPRYDLAGWIGRRMGYAESSRNCHFRCSYCSLTAEGRAYTSPGPRRPPAPDRRHGPARGHLLPGQPVLRPRSGSPSSTAWPFCASSAGPGYFRYWHAFVSDTFLWNDENLALAREAGCFSIFVGVESFDEGWLRRVNKPQNNRYAQVDLIRKCLDGGILFQYGLVFDPTERTLAEMHRELALICDNPEIPAPNFIFMAVPFPATPFFHDRLARGLILPDTKVRDLEGSTLTLRPLDPIEDVARFIATAKNLRGYAARHLRRHARFLWRYRRSLSAAQAAVSTVIVGEHPGSGVGVEPGHARSSAGARAPT